MFFGVRAHGKVVSHSRGGEALLVKLNTTEDVGMQNMAASAVRKRVVTNRNTANMKRGCVVFVVVLVGMHPGIKTVQRYGVK